MERDELCLNLIYNKNIFASATLIQIEYVTFLNNSEIIYNTHARFTQPYSPVLNVNELENQRHFIYLLLKLFLSKTTKSYDFHVFVLSSKIEISVFIPFETISLNNMFIAFSFGGIMFTRAYKYLFIYKENNICQYFMKLRKHFTISFE